MVRYWFVLLAISSSLVLGCPGSLYQIARMNAEEIKSLPDKKLCFASDSNSRNSIIVAEVSRRNIDCVQILTQANIPMNFIHTQIKPGSDLGSSPQSAASTGDCSGVEFMGVYSTDPVVGVSYYVAKVRNRTNITKIVTIGFKPTSSPSVRQARDTLRESKGATESAHVKPGDIASINLDLSDRAPQDVRIVSCE